MMTPVFASTSTIPSTFSSHDFAISRLQESIRGSVLTPDHADFAPAWSAWVANVQHSPGLVVLAETAQDVVAAVSFARDYELPVAVQATGHGAAAPIIGGVLVNTCRMKGYSVDPVKATARVEAGVKWSDIIEELHKYGLAGLNGSTTDVGIVGYTLGGGTGWFARKYGFAADQVVAADLVTAEGELLHVTAETYPDLFWAIRGGTGNFGIVTALEFGLIPVDNFFGGAIYYDLAEAPRIMKAYVEWVQTLPESVTSSISLMRFPAVPLVPEPLQGRNVVVIRAAGPVAGSEFLIEPMRKLGEPIVDTYGYYPYTAIDIVSTDPVDPLPEISSSYLLHSLTPEGIDSLLDVTGADADFPILMLEIRHIDGAARKASFDASAANRHDVPYMVLALGVPFVPEMVPALEAAHAQLAQTLAPMSTGHMFTNFVMFGDDAPGRTKLAYQPEVYARLQRIKAKYDPTNRFRFNRNIPPAE
jgi:FAD/FMN-containing dehydrogenase